MVFRLLLQSIPQSPHPSLSYHLFFPLLFQSFLNPPPIRSPCLMKWPYLILWSPWERCNCIKTVNPCPYNCYRCLSLLSPLSLSITLSPSVSSYLSLKSSKSVLRNLMFYFLSSQNGTCIISHYVFVDLLWCLSFVCVHNSFQLMSEVSHCSQPRADSLLFRN